MKKKENNPHKKPNGKLKLRYSQTSDEPEKTISALKKEIQEDKGIQQSLINSNKHYKGIIQSAMDAIISVDSNERIIVFNEAAEVMFKCNAGEVLGTSISRFIPDRFKKVHSSSIRVFGHTGITNRSMGRLGSVWGIRADGEEFPVEAFISQAEESGEKIYTVILRDVTEKKTDRRQHGGFIKRKNCAFKSRSSAYILHKRKICSSIPSLPNTSRIIYLH